jgi:SAM-dependent methyltransferase
MSERPDEFVDELADPVSALPSHFGVDVAYDARSHRPILGPAVTLARKGLIGLLTWWLRTALERQDHVNRLVARALEQLRQSSASELDGRLAQVERFQRAHESADKLADLEREALGQALSREVPLAPDDEARIIRWLGAVAGRRVLVIGGGVSQLLGPLASAGIEITFVDTDASAVAEAAKHGVAARQLSLDVFLQSVADASIDGAISAMLASRVALHHLPVVLRQIGRVLRPGGSLVLVAPDPRSIAVLREGVWRDPAAARPLPRELLEDVLRFAGFAPVETVPIGRPNAGLTEEGDEERRANIRLLNETLFGPPAYAILARGPA